MDKHMNTTPNTIKTITRSLAAMTCSLLLGACSKALIYSEGTNVSIATVKVNDDAAKPLSVNFGLERGVATIAPPKKTNGEAVNMISGFKLEKTGDDISGTLTIKTQFASGGAGLGLATQNPQAAAQIMNVTSVAPDSADLRLRKIYAAEFIRKSNNATALKAVAERMNVKNNRPDIVLSITDALNNADANLFNTYASIIKEELGSPF
ncbi:MAG: hypothetical protein HY941_05150 [Gammaproteobacteria bacterium]|nr:hypothetical protein [Gammaproteobacteria bacterium]